MIDWLAIIVASVITTTLVGFFGYLAWKISVSDSLSADETSQVSDAANEKKRKDKAANEKAKKKRKDQKKPKRETKHGEPTVQTSEETDDEQESEQELVKSSNNAETSSKARKRNKNKPVVPSPPASTVSTTHAEPKAKDVKAPNVTRAPPATHPKSIAKDEPEPTKQQTKVQAKPAEVPKKQIFPASSQQAAKKPTPTTEKQLPEQPFTVVGGNRNKTAVPPPQQQQQQPQNKPQVPAAPVAAPVQPPPTQVHHEQLGQRQRPVQKEAPVPVNGLAANPTPVKQQPPAPQKVPAKVADIIKVLPSSQAVVTELMLALDAFPLSTDELDIIMHKIANKQSVLRQDWTKLQQGKKVDPQAHIGQVMDESAKAYEDEMKNNAMKRVKELTDELNAEKLRFNVLLKEKSDKEREIQILHAQFNATQHKHEATNTNPHQRQQLQTLELQVKRLTEENINLTHQLAQQQQQQLVTSKLVASGGDSSNIQFQVLSDQIKKLSVDNAQLEKKAKSNELLAKEAQQEKENLHRYNEQLTQTLQKTEKELKHIEEKHHKAFNEIQTSHLNEINEYKRRVEQLEKDNEQLRHEEVVHVEPTTVTDVQTITINNEEREKLEKEISDLKNAIDANQEKEREFNNLKQKLTAEIEEYKNKLDNVHKENQSRETELKQEIERLKQNSTNEQQQVNESFNNELAAKNTEISTLRAELDDAKSLASQLEERLQQQREKHQQILTNFLPSDIRNQLSHDNHDFDKWLLSYEHLFESSQKRLQEEHTAAKNENEQLHRNMNDVANQLKDIEKTVQYKEEALLTELKSRDATVESIRTENDQLNGELQRLRNEIQRLQSAYDESVSEISALKIQIDDRFLVAANTPPVDSDQSFEIIKHPSPLSSPGIIGTRAEEINELIRSGKEALEHQESITQQLNKHLNDMHLSGTGETTTSNAGESTVVTSTDQQS